MVPIDTLQSSIMVKSSSFNIGAPLEFSLLLRSQNKPLSPAQPNRPTPRPKAATRPTAGKRAQTPPKPIASPHLVPSSTARRSHRLSPPHFPFPPPPYTRRRTQRPSSGVPALNSSAWLRALASHVEREARGAESPVGSQGPSYRSFVYSASATRSIPFWYVCTLG